jgi:hypothetical protein
MRAYREGDVSLSVQYLISETTEYSSMSIAGLHNKLLTTFKSGLYWSNTAHTLYEVQTDHHVFKNNK